MLRLITLIGGLVLLWAIFAFGGRTRAPVIEEDIRGRTSAAVADAGFAGVTVDADGRDVRLEGTVASESEIDAAETVLGVCAGYASSTAG